MNQKEAVEFAIMKKDIKIIGSKLDDHIKDQKKDIDKIIKKLDDFIKESDLKYVRRDEFNNFKEEYSSLESKKTSWSQSAVGWFVGIIMLLLTFYMNFIAK